MKLCTICGNGLLSIRNRNYHLIGCCVGDIKFWIKNRTKIIGGGIGLLQSYKCRTCNKYKWGMLMKHVLRGGCHIDCGESYYVVEICRKCCRKRFHNKKMNINKGIDIKNSLRG